MQVCTIYHTGVYNSAAGVIKDNKVYLQGENDNLYFPKNSKWGLIDSQNRIIVPFQSDSFEEY